jgi:hypothetical protein
VRPRYGEVANLRGVTSQYLILGGGYGYTQPIFKQSFVAISGLLGYGFHRQKADLGGIQDWKFDQVNRIGLRPALGYNHGDWTAAFSLLVDANVWPLANSNFQQATFALKFVVGYRIRDIKLAWLDSVKESLPSLSD